MIPHGPLVCLAFLSWTPFIVLGALASEPSIPLTGQAIPLIRRTSLSIPDADKRGLFAKAQRDAVITRYFGGTPEVRRSSGSNVCVYIILGSAWRRCYERLTRRVQNHQPMVRLEVCTLLSCRGAHVQALIATMARWPSGHRPCRSTSCSTRDLRECPVRCAALNRHIPQRSMGDRNALLR